MRPSVRKIHLLGVGGIGMGTLASMLKEKGFEVSGSDRGAIYPPMSTQLERLRIPVAKGYRPENIRDFRPDLVVVGNHIRRENPEAAYAMENGLEYLSMPEAIRSFFLPSHESVVVAGTHGKSTTTALLGWALTEAGRDPSVFVGGVIKGWEKGHRVGRGRFMVVEGDEYDTAFFDKGPKFLHYQPQTGILTGVEYDHADIYPDVEAVLEAFRRFVRLIPPRGCLVANGDDPRCRLLASECAGEVVLYGWSREALYRFHELQTEEGRVLFRFSTPEGENRVVVSRLPGRHNAANVLAAMAVLDRAGISAEQASQAVETFPGLRRRQDIVGEAGGVLVVDDFAHHPTAVRETLGALREFHPRRRLLAVFEPRTNTSRRRFFQHEYATAFNEAELVCIQRPSGLEDIPPGDRLDPELLASDIRKAGPRARAFDSVADILAFLEDSLRPGDLVVCMSNGSFDDLPRRLLQRLSSKGSNSSTLPLRETRTGRI